MTEHEAWVEAAMQYGPDGDCQIGICSWLDNHERLGDVAWLAMRDKIRKYAPPASRSGYRWGHDPFDRVSRAAFCLRMAEMTRDQVTVHTG